jgi:rRNA processing protein Krr1/Pno1
MRPRTMLLVSAEELDLLKQVIGRPSRIDGKIDVWVERPNSVIIEANDQEKLFRASNTIKALSLGFSLDESRGLMNYENYLLMVPLRAELPPRDKRKKTSSSSSRSRLFSFESLNMRVIQKFTGVAFKLRDDNMWMIGPTDSVIEASRETRQIIMGRTRGTVQQYHRGKRGIRVNLNRR